ncbi:hypothetical protein NUW58_g883 [Xylaria curta]|uniref:Uncharacterized protein n=1 Tax=Xylaria curta TaxID=42375 RepID=A0ACC1PQW8_9PEZI|nr:hypothetical protein NUW58_g883 [Xylaria curta]
MAPASHGKNMNETLNGVMDGNVPPPSTLAAQLVENISTSARSSRPDETAELQRLFAAIEKVKNDPALLTSYQDRIEHNHMLIYVYARVVLEGLKWDEPFANLSQLRADALRAINFLKITVKETPDVLLFVADDGAFLFRGPEPLWVWIFPKILKLLGNGSCADLTAPIVAFFRELYLRAARSKALWAHIPRFLAYLRNIFDVAQSCLAGLSPSPNRDPILKLRLPQDSFLESLGYAQLRPLQEQCTYTINPASHALRHAIDLLSLLSIPLVGHQLSSNAPPIFQETIPWLVDASVRINAIQSSWRDLSGPCLPRLLRSTIEILDAMKFLVNTDILVKQKTYILLVHLCVDALTRRQAALGLENVTGVDDTLLSVVIIIGKLEAPTGCGNIAPEGTDLWRTFELLRRMTRDPPPASLDPIVQSEQFVDPEIRRYVQEIPVCVTGNEDLEPQLKRRKTALLQTLPEVINLLWKFAGLETRENLADYSNVLQATYPGLSEPEKIHVIHLIADICCAADETLIMTSDGKELPRFNCFDCRNSRSIIDASTCIDMAAKKFAIEIFVCLLQTTAFTESRKPRVAAMVSLRRIAKHCDFTEFIDMEVSFAAQWCLKSLHSSQRELRIAAGRTLAFFLAHPGRSGIKYTVAQKNRGIALGVLRNLSDQNQPKFTESCILAWSQASLVLPDDELILVLVKLVEYLGHQSAVASAAAFTEIVQIARHRSITPRQLFDLYWSSLAYLAVRDIIAQPKLARLLAEMQDITIAELLLHVQTYALPYLVLNKKKDVIQMIAEARKETEPWQPCLDNDNLGRILALLLAQETADVQQYTMSLLRFISPHFDEFSLVDLLQIEPLTTTLHILKAAADADESRKQHIRGALNQMASMILVANGESKKKNHATGNFLHHHALGLMAHLTNVINDISVISACLLAAMSHDELRAAAFSCWASMLYFFEESEVDILVETTFYLINQYWPTFENVSRQLSEDLIRFLLEKQHATVEKYINKLPSFSHIKELSDIELTLSKLRSPLDNHTAFFLLAERLYHETSGVVLHALRELVEYLQRHQGYLQASAVSEQPDSIISNLIRALLDCASRYNGFHDEISALCAQCIGLVGCLDSNLFEAARGENQMIVTSNFEDSRQVTDFVFFLLEKVLVLSFVSTTDTNLQGFLSYAMQELLDRSNIAEAIKMEGLVEGEAAYRRWCLVSQSAQEILTPFITSRFRINPMPYQQIEYPIFDKKNTYTIWMRNLTLDCLRKPQNPFAMLLFEPLCRVIRAKDLSIAEFLFPYLIVHIILGEEIPEQERTAVLHELHAVLKYELPADASYAEREDRKLYCEASSELTAIRSAWR